MHFGACFIHSLIFNCFFFVDFGPATLATLVGAGPIESLPLIVKAIGHGGGVLGQRFLGFDTMLKS